MGCSFHLGVSNILGVPFRGDRGESLLEKGLKVSQHFCGVPIIRTIVYWGLCWGPLMLRNYPLPTGEKVLRSKQAFKIPQV